MKTEWIKRYEKFCKAFDLKVGDVIQVTDWFCYIVGKNGFHNDNKKHSKHQPFEIIVDRGFDIVGYENIE